MSILDPKPPTRTENDAKYAQLPNINVTTLTVKADGSGQFTSPKLANDSIATSGPNKTYIILVYPGEYKDGYDWNPKPYVTVRGTNRETCILSYYVPVDSNDQAVRDRSTITLTKTARLENLTISIEGGRYAVHSEEAGANKDALHNVVNCKLVHKGYDAVNAWRAANPGAGYTYPWVTSQAAWGAGTGSGVEETFEDSAFESPYGPFYWHNSSNGSPDKPTKGRMTRCRVTTPSVAAGGVTLNSLGSGMADSFVFTDCQFDTMFVYHTDTSWFVDSYANHCDIRITFDRCSPVGYQDDSRGLALMVTSGFGDPGVLGTVRMSGSAVPVIFGVPTFKDGTGDVGFQPYAYGTQDISGITLGFNNTVGNNTLGKKLGNRTGSPLTLSVWNQGFYQKDYTFNADYTAMTNQQIIDLLNAAMSGFVFSTYNPAKDVYPHVLGSESKLVNNGAGIAQWSAVAWDPSRRSIRPMATGDAIGLFAGIALERIPKGQSGRILGEGIMHKSQLLGLTAGGFTAGNTLYHSDATGGQFATTGTRSALTARHADWAYFKAAV